jgi:hypothetical protein
LKQSSAVHNPASYSADVILPGSSSKLRLLVLGSSGSGLTNNLQHHIKPSTFIFNFSIGNRAAQAMNTQPAEIRKR